jgi:LysR family transcriptional regulator, transcription activator of glutamate synthase operon
VTKKRKNERSLHESANKPDISQVTFRDLEIFLEFSRTEHLGETAEALGYSVASIQRAVRALEERLAVRLVKRSGRRILLLHAGRVLADHASQLIRSRVHAVENVQIAAGRRTSRLVIGHNFSLGLDLVPALVAGVLRTLPDTHVVLQSGSTNTLISQVLSGGLDAAIVSPPPIEPDLEVIGLSGEPTVLVVGARDPLAKRAKVDVAELRERDFVSLSEGTGSRQTLFQVCARAGFTPRVTIEAGDLLAVAGIVAAGLAISIVPSRLAIYEQGRLRHIELAAPAAADRMIALAYLRRARAKPSLAKLREAAVSHMAQTASIIASGATK